MEMDQNPFAPPQADARTPFTAASTAAEAETIRRQFLSHESAVRAIGALYLLGAFFGGVGGVLFLGLASSGQVFDDESMADSSLWVIMITLMFLLLLLWVWIGWGLRHLNNAARIGGIVYGSLGVLQGLVQWNPILLIMQVIFLYYLASAKGRYVCSKEYRQIMQTTPHIKPKISWILIAFFVLVLLLVAIIILAVLFGGPSGPI